ncbi:MAG: methylated-DNA--[protein]-cysteine S-methyltransferase [Oscillospiraceae bacterium]|nr:methylated-DNA--[protein]-cysteine S-methyltransferase [Oscillospiraceae bacterium]
MYEYKYVSAVGLLELQSDGEALTALSFRRARCAEREMEENGNVAAFADAKRWLDIYFSGRKPDFIPAIKPAGTEFQKLVWGYISEIPYGGIVTYGALAARAATALGKDKMSAQAVGGAVGRNPMGIIIPCHRVVGADGSLTGFTGGLPIKKKLLALEGNDMSQFHMPK